ncbi:AtpZ/AtpI family protein [Pontiella sp.]|uniref:AtpZ/AtpI family protein n=1 Tax=Pontiella sp. TaxID=2837462 RepID=UPI0035616654
MIGSNKEDGDSFEERRKISTAMGFGTSFAAGMAVFGLGGHWLDGKYDKEPLFTLIGIGLGLFYGAYELWKLILMTNRQHDETEHDRHKGEE